MLSRRKFIGGSAAGLVAARANPAPAAAVLTDDGLYTQPWFLQSFLEYPDDLQAAADKGKRFAVLWELRGCPYCKQLHLVNFAKPEIESFIKARFEILQLNIGGSREVTDFDGEKLSEKQMAQKYGVRYTPTLQFFPETAAGLGPKPPREREVARSVGYVEPAPFLATFRYVAEHGYEKGGLSDYLKRGG
jgi:thioredoxin-related protein